MHNSNNIAGDIKTIIQTYGERLQGIAAQAVDRVMMFDPQYREIEAVKECTAFKKLTQQWVDDFKGMDSEKLTLVSVLEIAQGTFRESLDMAIKRGIAQQAAQPTFQEMMKQVKKEAKTYKYPNLDALVRAVCISHNDHIDWSIARANDIVEAVTVAAQNVDSCKRLVAQFDRAVAKVRIQMWERIRPYKADAPEAVVDHWVDQQVAGAVHYSTVILSGISRNRNLSKNQSEMFEKHLINVREKYAKELNMNNAANTNTASSTNENVTDVTENTMNDTAKATAETTTSTSSTAEELNMNNTADNTAETTDTTANDAATETTAKEGFFKRTYGKVKGAATAAVEKVKAVNWKKVGKYALIFLAFLLALAAILFGIKKAKEGAGDVFAEVDAGTEGIPAGAVMDSVVNFFAAIFNGAKAGAAWVFNAFAAGFKAIANIFSKSEVVDTATDTAAEMAAA